MRVPEKGWWRMSGKSGHEMRKFLVATSVLIVLIVAGVILYTTIDGIKRVDREMKTEKERVTMQLVSYFHTSLEEIARAASDPEIMQLFNPEYAQSADIAQQLKFLQAITDIQRAQFAGDYMAYVSGGMALSSSVKEGLDITEFPQEVPEGGYEVLTELGGRRGTFISVFAETDISPMEDDEFIILVLDRSAEFAELEDFYAEEKSSLVNRQVVTGIVAVVVAGILTALGVYLLTRRYITGPIAELTDVSHRIMEGTFEGDVQVVEESDYADIQRLLKSGKVLMEKMGEE